MKDETIQVLALAVIVVMFTVVCFFVVRCENTNKFIEGGYQQVGDSASGKIIWQKCK